jgi:hypothetical protein
MIALALMTGCSEEPSDRTTRGDTGVDASPADVDVSDIGDTSETDAESTRAPDTPDAADLGTPDVDPPDTGRPDTGGDTGGDADPECEADSDSDGLIDCDERELCTDPNDGDTDDDGLSDFEEVDGDTDPCDPDTDGDGIEDGAEVAHGLDPTSPNPNHRWRLQACDEPEGEPVDFHESAAGNWRVALPPSFDNFRQLQIQSSAANPTAAVYGNPALQAAGALLTREAESPVGSPSDVLEGDVRRSLETLGRMSQNQTGGAFDTHDGWRAAVGEYVVEPTDGGATVRQFREDLAVALSPFDESRVTGLPVTDGTTHEALRVFVSVVLREYPTGRDQRLVAIAVTPEQAYRSRGKVRMRMEDLTNTTNVSEVVDLPATRCAKFDAARPSPKVDFYWVLDQSGSMIDHNEKLAAFAEQFENTVDNTALDYRFGVTNMDKRNDGHLRLPPGWHTDSSKFRTEVQKAVIDCQDQPSWICGGANEFGLESAKRGITYMSGNGSTQPGSDERLRPDASLITIFMSDDEAKTIDYGNAGYNQLVKPYLQFFPNWTTAFSIVADDKDCGTQEGRAYKDVALETGGKVASLCSDDLTRLLEQIIFSAAGESSTYELPETPISSSLRVYMNGEWVPRNRENGFAYYEGQNAIAFFGNYRPTPEDELHGEPGDYIAVHYETFKNRCKRSGSSDCL